MNFLGRKPTTKEFPKTATQEGQKFQIGFGTDGMGAVGFSLWKIGFAIGPLYSGSLDQPDLAAAQLLAAVEASKKESK